MKEASWKNTAGSAVETLQNLAGTPSRAYRTVTLGHGILHQEPGVAVCEGCQEKKKRSRSPVPGRAAARVRAGHLGLDRERPDVREDKGDTPPCHKEAKTTSRRQGGSGPARSKCGMHGAQLAPLNRDNKRGTRVSERMFFSSKRHHSPDVRRLLRIG